MDKQIPGAWYDACAHVDQARSVLESVPDLVSLAATGSGDMELAGNLVHAAYSLLMLASHDLERIEQELKTGR